MSTGMLRRHHAANGHSPNNNPQQSTGTKIADVLPADPPNSVKTDSVKLEMKGTVKPKLTKEAKTVLMKQDEKPEVKLDVPEEFQ